MTPQDARDLLLVSSDILVTYIDPEAARRHYRNVSDTKSGKRPDVAARLSFQTACD
jgi:hypothetical protein